MRDDIKKELIIEDKTLIVCIGNDFRADDGIGPYIAKKLKIKNKNIEVIDAGSVLENHINTIIEKKPKKLIIIDAGMFNGKFGEIAILKEGELSNYKIISTHSFPLEAILKIIREDLKDIKITILAIEPKNLDYKEGLSTEVKKSADEIINYFKTI